MSLFAGTVPGGAFEGVKTPVTSATSFTGGRRWRRTADSRVWGNNVMTAAIAKRLGPGWIVAICFAIAALEGYDIQAFGVSAPHLAPELGLDAGQMGWAGSAAMIGLVIGALTGGWFADRVGRRLAATDRKLRTR